MRADSTSFTFFRQLIVYFLSLGTDSSSFRLVAALSAVRGPSALVGLPGSARSVSGPGLRAMRYTLRIPGKYALGHPTTGHVVPARQSLATGLVGRTRHRGMSQVSAPADIHGGQLVAEE